MTLIEKLQFIERIDALIRRSATGTPKQLAHRLNISERGLFKTLNLMKKMGAPIYYSISKESYTYKYEVEFRAGFSVSKGQLRNVVGGVRKMFFTAQKVQSIELN